MCIVTLSDACNNAQYKATPLDPQCMDCHVCKMVYGPVHYCLWLSFSFLARRLNCWSYSPYELMHQISICVRSVSNVILVSVRHSGTYNMTKHHVLSLSSSNLCKKLYNTNLMLRWEHTNYYSSTMVCRSYLQSCMLVTWQWRKRTSQHFSRLRWEWLGECVLGLRASGNLPVSYVLTGNLPVTYHQ